MTLIEIIDAARDLVNEPVQTSLTARSFPDNTSSFFTDNQMTTYVNLVQQEVQQEIIQVFEDFFITQSTLNIDDGCAIYSLPSDFVKMRRVEDARNSSAPGEIVPIGLNDRHNVYSRQTTSNTTWVTGYYLNGTTIGFDQTPTFTESSGVRMHYIKRLTDISDATSISEIPVEYHRVMVWGVVKLALYQQQTPNEVAIAEYNRGLRQLKEFAERRQIQRSRSVKRRKVDVL